MLSKLEGAVLKLEGAAQKHLEDFWKFTQPRDAEQTWGCRIEIRRCRSEKLRENFEKFVQLVDVAQPEGAVTKHTTEKSYKFGAQQFAARPKLGSSRGIAAQCNPKILLSIGTESRAEKTRHRRCIEQKKSA